MTVSSNPSPSRLLGVRLGSDVLRYAVVDVDNGTAVWVNRKDEHKWSMPKTAKTKADELAEVYAEIQRILRIYPGVSALIIKSPEFRTGFRTKADSLTISYGAAVSLAATHLHVPVEEVTYANLKLQKADIDPYVLRFVEKPEKYWDEKIKDALAAALRRHGF